MKCICCGKDLPNNATAEERSTEWHGRCVKKFFGTDVLPDIDVSDETLRRLAIESTNKGFTVPGVQKKLSLHLTDDKVVGKPRLTLVNYPMGYILKPQTEEYAALPEAEYLVMSMAKAVGIKTVPLALIRMNGKYAYITKRIDRVQPKGRNQAVQMLAMEDFCQLDGRLTQDKYKGSYERCAKIVAAYSSRAGIDRSGLFLRVVFSFVVGNSDMHLKNFSLIETAAGSCEYVLSDAYDMLPVNVILPEDNEQCALTLNGKKRNLGRKDFLVFAENCGIVKKAAEKLIDTVISKEDDFAAMCRESLMPDAMKETLEALIHERISRIRVK